MANEIGIDIVEITRFDKYNKDSNKALSKIFSKSELEHCFEKSMPSVCLAGKYAAKEAIAKAFSVCDIKITNFNMLEIINDKTGKPTLRSSLSLSEKNVKISIAHDGGFAIAVASVEV